MSHDDCNYLYRLFVDAVSSRARHGAIDMSEIFKAWRINTSPISRRGARIELALFVGFIIGAQYVLELARSRKSLHEISDGHEARIDFAMQKDNLLVEIYKQVSKRMSVKYYKSRDC